VRFGFTDDQLAFREGVRDLLEKECPPEVVRAAWPQGGSGAGARADGAAVEGVWCKLAEMGVLGMLAPEARGGMGLDELDLVLVLEETGYAAVPLPVVEHAAIAVPMMAQSTSGPEPLAALLDGTTRVSVAAEPWTVVPWIGAVDRLIVQEGNDAHLVDARTFAPGSPDGAVDGARRTAVPSRVPGDGERQVLVSGTAGRRAWELAFDRGALGSAAQLIGLSRRMLDLTVAYVGERRQFGAPVGSFQAVKHHLADALLHLSFARPAVYRAAHSVARDTPTRARDVSMAKAMASDAARLVGSKALQCHGAVGYTVEYDLHLYLKRAWALAATWGTASWHCDRVGRALGV